MNKSELISSGGENATDKKDSEKAVTAVLTSSPNSLQKMRTVLVGFGTFEVRHRAARNGRNPSTKEEILIPATKAPAFKAGKNLKIQVNK